MENFMRSSGASGAGALGFRVGTASNTKRRSLPKALLSALDFSRTTAAVAATAFLAASLFVAYDINRTISDAQQSLVIIGEMLAAEIALRSPAEASAALQTAALRSGGLVKASLSSGPGPAPGLLSRSIPAGPHGMLALDVGHAEALAGIAGRGAAAFALAGLFTFAASRRRKGMPSSEQRDNYRHLAAAIPMGLACWAATGQLIVCNQHYLRRLDLGDAPLTYHQAVSRLVAGGYMKLVRED